MIETMKNEAILIPSGRSITLLTVVQMKIAATIMKYQRTRPRRETRCPAGSPGWRSNRPRLGT